MLPTFCRAVGLSVPEKSKSRNECIQHIIDFHDTGVLWDHIKNDTKSGAPKKIEKKTQPQCVNQYGTYIRLILTFTSELGRGTYLSTKNKLVKDQLDS